MKDKILKENLRSEQIGFNTRVGDTIIINNEYKIVTKISGSLVHYEDEDDDKNNN